MGSYKQWENATFRWDHDRWMEGIQTVMRTRVMIVAEHLRNKVVKNISAPSRTMGRSKAGQFPRADSVRLRNTIFRRFRRKGLTAQVGTNLDYGLWLEYGTKATVIFPKKGRFLSWIDPTSGKRIYARKVTRGPIKGRSFLRRTLWEERSFVKRFLTRALPAGATGKVSFDAK